MRALPILAALLCTAPFAKASATELDLLQSRCQEQERQIRQLEEENSRLKSLVATAAKTPAPAEAPAKTESKKEEEKPKAAAPAKTADTTASYGIVRSGDTLNKIAQRHRTSPEALAELNHLKKPYPIRAGQRLRLPDKPAATAKTAVASSEAAASEKPKSAAPHGGTHTVKAGETFFSIARHYGMSANALQSANPGVKAINLRVGQTLQLGGKPTPAAAKPTTTAAAPPAKASEPAAAAKSPSEPKHEVAKAKATETTPKPAAETKAAAAPEAPAPAPAAAAQPVANGARIRTVAIEETTPLSNFAAAHGTSIARLNALNGLNLNSSTVLAKGSELYVPAQP